ncbi:MAG: FAD:protein FMN transferase [Planctomycetota bacterium]|jgi:thiamine biosynthesis lipoprotein
MERGLSRRELLAQAGLCAATAPFLTLAACLPDDARRPLCELRGRTMGTRYRLRFRPPRYGIDDLALHAAIGGLFRRVNERMSAWRGDSELAGINGATPGQWVPVSEATRAVVVAAKEMHARSGGAFDPTVGALVDGWGFGPSRAPRAVPSRARQAALRDGVDGRAIETRASPSAVRRTRPDTRLDLSAIAQGHAVDAVAALLAARHVEHFLLELGGELRAGGRATPDRPWYVAVERPHALGRIPWCVVRLDDGAIATSGVYRNCFEEDGRRYSHVIDPRTGCPVAHRLLSVSVIAGDATTADAAATALLVLGPEEGKRFARAGGLAALFAVEASNGVRAVTTPSFASRLVDPEGHA